MTRSLAATAAFALATSGAHAAFTLASPDIPAGGTIANRFVFNMAGCKGENRSPALRWSGAPQGTGSFALTVFDPDAPAPGWWHWVVVNIPATADALPAGAGDAKGAQLPAGSLQLRNDFGSPGWGGPCPPPGDKPHRYVFTLYALRAAKLDLAAGARPAAARALIEADALARASFTATYGRPKGH